MSGNQYMKHIYDLTYFYIKKKYKKILKETNSKYIEKEKLKDTIQNLLVNEKIDYRIYILNELKKDFDNVEEREINELFDDMEEDTDMICNKIEKMIDEYQIQKGYYN